VHAIPDIPDRTSYSVSYCRALGAATDTATASRCRNRTQQQRLPVAATGTKPGTLAAGKLVEHGWQNQADQGQGGGAETGGREHRDRLAHAWDEWGESRRDVCHNDTKSEGFFPDSIFHAQVTEPAIFIARHSKKVLYAKFKVFVKLRLTSGSVS
jgi:hypothetical protein